MSEPADDMDLGAVQVSEGATSSESDPEVKPYAESPEAFWTCTKKAFNAPYSFNKHHADLSYTRVSKLYENSPEFSRVIDGLNRYIMLRGEALVVYTTDTAQVLTNYRTIFEFDGVEHNIPLEHLEEYSFKPTGWKPGGFTIRYQDDGKPVELPLIDDMLGDEPVNAVLRAREFESLDEDQKELLKHSRYGWEAKHGSPHPAPSIAFLELTEEEQREDEEEQREAEEEQRQLAEKLEQAQKDVRKYLIILAAVVLAVVVIVVVAGGGQDEYQELCYEQCEKFGSRCDDVCGNKDCAREWDAAKSRMCTPSGLSGKGCWDMFLKTVQLDGSGSECEL